MKLIVTTKELAPVLGYDQDEVEVELADFSIAYSYFSYKDKFWVVGSYYTKDQTSLAESIRVYIDTKSEGWGSDIWELNEVEKKEITVKKWVKV